MIEVVDQEYFHIHRVTIDALRTPNKHSNLWQIGNTLEFGANENLLYDRIFNTFFEVDKENSYLKDSISRHLSQYSGKSKKQMQIDFFNSSFLGSYLQLTREITLEEIRAKYFIDKPSRLNGIFLSDEVNIKKWLKIIPQNSRPQKLFLVKFTGKIHEGDERWITNKSLSLQSYINNALGYWQGIAQSKRGEPTVEYIGEGKLTVIEEIKR